MRCRSGEREKEVTSAGEIARAITGSGKRARVTKTAQPKHRNRNKRKKEKGFVIDRKRDGE